jgi:hypothetical protein
LCNIVKLIIYALIIAAIIWLIISVLIPLAFINIAIILLITSFAKKGWRKFLYPLSFFGAIFLELDYNNGWFTKTIVHNVSFFKDFIPIFLYVNILSGLLALYFLIRNFLNEKKPKIESEGEFSKRNLIIMGSLILIGVLTIGLQKYFDSEKSNKQTISIVPASDNKNVVTTSKGQRDIKETNNRDFYITASSVMSPYYGITYNTDNVRDENLSTWWSPKNMQNCWIELNFNIGQNVRGLKIHAGSHYENFIAPDGTNFGNLYNKNLRIKTARLDFSDGSSAMITLSDIDELQTVTFNPHKTSYIKLTPLTFFSSTKWNDVCISQLNPIF